MGAALLWSLRIPRSQYSEFELYRRQDMGDSHAAFGLKRIKALPQLLGLQVSAVWLLMMCMAWLCVVAFGWVGGVGASVVGLLTLSIMSKFGVLKRTSQKIYRKYENSIIQFVLAHKKSLDPIMPLVDQHEASHGIGSREELEHIIRESRSLVTKDEASVMERSLTFFGRNAESIMTPIAEVTTVEAGELLGPLVLDDLHRTGHTLFPVTNGNEIVGLLDIADSVGLRSHESPAVRDTMRHEMIRVTQDEPLDEVLRIFIDTKQPCVLVMREDREIVGLISLGDIVRSLTGWARRH